MRFVLNGFKLFERSDSDVNTVKERRELPPIRQLDNIEIIMKGQH